MLEERNQVRERRAAGESIAAIARETRISQALVRSWCRGIEVPSEAETRRQARANAWLRELIEAHCEESEFTLEKTGRVSYVVHFSHVRRFLAARLANYLGGSAWMNGDTITIEGIEVELTCIASPHWMLN